MASRWRGFVPLTLAGIAASVAALGLMLALADKPPANPSDAGPWEGTGHDVGLFLATVFGLIWLLMLIAGVLLRSRYHEAGRRLAWATALVVPMLFVILFGGGRSWVLVWLFVALTVGLVVASVVTGVRAERSG